MLAQFAAHLSKRLSRELTEGMPQLSELPAPRMTRSFFFTVANQLKSYHPSHRREHELQILRTRQAVIAVLYER